MTYAWMISRKLTEGASPALSSLTTSHSAIWNLVFSNNRGLLSVCACLFIWLCISACVLWSVEQLCTDIHVNTALWQITDLTFYLTVKSERSRVHVFHPLLCAYQNKFTYTKPINIHWYLLRMIPWWWIRTIYTLIYKYSLHPTGK